MKFFGAMGPGRGTNRLDFGGDLIAPVPILPQYFTPVMDF